MLAILSILVVGIGYYMFHLFQDDSLWGQLPFFFLTALWALIVLLNEKRFTKNGWRWLGLSTLAGILLSLSFPPIPLTILIFIGFVPLLLVEQEIIGGGKEVSKNEVFKFAYNTFVVWNILTTWWVANTAFFAAFIAIWLNSFFMAIPFLLFHKSKKLMPIFGYATLIAFWIAFEFLHLRWEISWPWLTLGNAFSEFPSWVQWFEYTGVPGGTFWVLLANILIFKLFQSGNWSLKPRDYFGYLKFDLLKVKALVLLPIAVSLVWYYNHEDVGRDVEVVVVQPNYEPHYMKFQAPASERRSRFIRLSKASITENTEYLVFPETSFWHYDDQFFDREEDIRALKNLSFDFPNLKIITGVISYHIFKDGEPKTKATRSGMKQGKPIFWEEKNAAIQLDGKSREIPVYTKSKLVPGAEIMPYRQIFGFLKPLFDNLGGSIEGHATQPEREVFTSNSGNVAPVICYESIYGEYVTEYVKKGAEAIFIITNDGWWDNSPGHKQHLKYATLRAIETRKSIARSANTGTSCFINQRGDIIQATDYEVEASVRGTIKFNDETTFYVQYGDLISRLCVFATALFLLNLLVKTYLPGKD